MGIGQIWVREPADFDLSAYRATLQVAQEDGMATEFKPGDVVRLKSGGPAMTVTAIGEHESQTKAFCEWFEGTKRHQGTFVLATLEASGPGDRPKPKVMRRNR
jgi:uncharacterized protein YodC (DUF2158 family)